MTTTNDTTTTKDLPWYAVPGALAIIMVSSGAFVYLLAKSIETFSSIGY
ncbi:hypothetical protein [uncultured Demequina sp.]|nr:hypothetical protein [uncultured Demequina sp.]